MVVSVAFLFVAVALFSVGTEYARELLEKTRATDTFAIRGEGLTLAEVDRALTLNGQREEGYSLVFWAQADDVRVQRGDLLRTGELAVVYTRGNAALLFPEANIAALPDDACFMSEGATQVLAARPGQDGLALQAPDGGYRAVGTLPSDRPFLVVRAADGSELLFDRLTIQADTGGSLVVTENTVAQTLGVGVSSLDYRVLAFLGLALLSATPFVLVVSLVVVAARAPHHERRPLASRALTLSCVGVGMLATTAIIIGALFEFSAWFPSRWSSSVEWAALTAGFFERLHLLFVSAVAVSDEAYYALFASTLLMGALSLSSLAASCHFYSVSTVRARVGHSGDSAPQRRPEGASFEHPLPSNAANTSVVGHTLPCHSERSVAKSRNLWVRAPGKQSSGLFSARTGRQAHGTHQRPIEQIGCFAAKDFSTAGADAPSARNDKVGCQQQTSREKP
jgi:hypothetical protein